MNNVPYRNSPPAPAALAPAARPGDDRRPGRPRVHVDAAAKQRDQRRREREQRQQVGELLAAARNARYEDPALHGRIQAGDDLAVLVALTEYFRERHWCRPRSVGIVPATPSSPSEPFPTDLVEDPPSD